MERTELATLSPKYSTSLTFRYSSLPDLWKDIESLPTIGKAEREIGETKVTALLTAKIGVMLEGLPTDITPAALKKLVLFIRMNYKNLRFSELDIIGMNLMRSNLYGKINLNTVVVAIDEYWNERMEYAEAEQIKKNHAFKHDVETTPEAVKEYYKQIREKKPEPKKNKGILAQKLKEQFGKEYDQSKAQYEKQQRESYEQFIDKEYRRLHNLK